MCSMLVLAGSLPAAQTEMGEYLIWKTAPQTIS